MDLIPKIRQHYYQNENLEKNKNQMFFFSFCGLHTLLEKQKGKYVNK